MRGKVFDEGERQQADPQVRRWVHEYGLRHGYAVEEHPQDAFDFDFSLTGPRVFHLEAEWARRWDTGTFPYHSLSIPSRKVRLLDKSSASVLSRLIFVTIRRDLALFRGVSSGMVAAALRAGWHRTTIGNRSNPNAEEDFINVPLHWTIEADGTVDCLESILGVDIEGLRPRRKEAKQNVLFPF